MKTDFRVFAAALAVSAALLSGCGSARSVLGTHASPCFRAIPYAARAVRHRGLLAGVRYEAAGEIVRPLEQLLRKAPVGEQPVPDVLTDVAHQAVCLVAYRGSFTLATVQRGWAPFAGKGKFVIVVVDQRSGYVVITLVLPAEPIRFAHNHILE